MAALSCQLVIKTQAVNDQTYTYMGERKTFTILRKSSVKTKVNLNFHLYLSEYKQVDLYKGNKV